MQQYRPSYLEQIQDFFWQTLEKSITFVTSIWIKIKQDFQHQQERVQDWASYLQNLKSILVEFNLRCTPAKKILCQYFYKGFWPFIKLWIDKKCRDIDGWNALIKKALWAKAKVKIQVLASCNINQQCQKDYQPMYTFGAKAQAQKNLRPKESKARSPKPTS